MGDAYLGEIRMMSFNFAPKGWAFCDGTLLQVNQYAALNALLGNTFGGTIGKTFALPDLRGRVPVCSDYSWNQETSQGAQGGLETVPLVLANVPQHTHGLQGTAADGTASDPALPPSGNALLASMVPLPATDSALTYAALDPKVGTVITMASASVANSGIGSGHNNLQPSGVVNFCIALFGLFPPRD